MPLEMAKYLAEKKSQETELTIDRILYTHQNKKLSDKRAQEEVIDFMRTWSFAKARRNADLSATIERRHNESLTLIRQIGVPLK